MKIKLWQSTSARPKTHAPSGNGSYTIVLKWIVTCTAQFWVWNQSVKTVVKREQGELISTQNLMFTVKVQLNYFVILRQKLTSWSVRSVSRSSPSRRLKVSTTPIRSECEISLQSSL